MKIIITGGHLSPALAVIEAFPKNVEVLIVGRKYTFEGDSNASFEYQTAKALKIPFQSIITGRLQRTFTRHTIPSLFKFPLGFFQAYRIIRVFKPDVILSFGGYVSLPVVLAGSLLQIPIVIHEQTLGAGLANRIGAIFAQKICISWESSHRFFPRSKVVLTGNPIRKFTVYSSQFVVTKNHLPIVYVTGGSAGSHTINVLVEGCIKRLLETFMVIHQTGDARDYKDFDRLQKLKDGLDTKLQKRYLITKFIDPSDIGYVLKTADLVVSRSGINTVTELLFFGKPALLIPLNKEQMENALFAKTVGFVEVVSQDKLTSDGLYNLIMTMMREKERYKNKAREIKENAARKIIKIVENIVWRVQ